MDIWRNQFNTVCRAVWHYLNQPLFERDATTFSRWPDQLTDRARRECIQWLEDCWQINLHERAEAVQLLERCWQRRCSLGKQG